MTLVSKLVDLLFVWRSFNNLSSQCYRTVSGPAVWSHSVWTPVRMWSMSVPPATACCTSTSAYRAASREEVNQDCCIALTELYIFVSLCAIKVVFHSTCWTDFYLATWLLLYWVLHLKTMTHHEPYECQIKNVLAEEVKENNDIACMWLSPLFCCIKHFIKKHFFLVWLMLILLIMFIQVVYTRHCDLYMFFLTYTSDQNCLYSLKRNQNRNKKPYSSKTEWVNT